MNITTESRINDLEAKHERMFSVFCSNPTEENASKVRAAKASLDAMIKVGQSESYNQWESSTQTGRGN